MSPIWFISYFLVSIYYSMKSVSANNLTLTETTKWGKEGSITDLLSSLFASELVPFPLHLARFFLFYGGKNYFLGDSLGLPDTISLDKLNVELLFLLDLLGYLAELLGLLLETGFEGANFVSLLDLCGSYLCFEGILKTLPIPLISKIHLSQFYRHSSY